jgi:hypothetical protein
MMQFVMDKAKESGTPFLSLFSPPEILSMAKDAGNAEAFLVATT